MDIGAKIIATNEIDTPDLQAIDQLIEESGNASLFHNPRFLQYHGHEKFKAPDFKWLHVLFEEKGKPIAFYPGAIVRSEGVSKYVSPLGASCGGIFSADLSFQRLSRCMEIWWEKVQEQGVAEALVTLAPEPYFCGSNGYLEFILNSQGFRQVAIDLNMIVQLDHQGKFKSAAEVFSDSSKRNLKKALSSSLVFGEEENLPTSIKEFYPLLVANREEKNSTPTHTLDELLAINKLTPQALRLFTAKNGESLVAGVLLFRMSGQCWNAFYPADCALSREHRGMDGLLACVFEKAISEGVSWIDLGPSSFGPEVHDSLVQFKHKHGGRGFLRRKYQWKALSSKKP